MTPDYLPLRRMSRVSDNDNTRRMRFRRTVWRPHQLGNRPARTLLVGGIAAALLGIVGASLLLLRSDPKRDFASTRPVAVPSLAPAHVTVAPAITPARAEPLPSALATNLLQAVPRTILEAPAVDVFAQDGNRIVWADGSAPCHEQVKIRSISGGAARSLVAKPGPTCTELGYWNYVAMALAGTRALWEEIGAGNTVYYGSIRTASPQDRVEHEVANTDNVDKESFRPLPAAGDGTTLVCACTGLTRVGANGRLFGIGDSGSAVAVEGRRVASVRRVPEPCVCNESPRWSPDGRTIYFTSSRSSHLEIYSVRKNGTNLRRLTSTPQGVESHFSVSPTGRSLIYSRIARMSAPQILIASIDGKRRRKLANGYAPTSSPDGRSVAYARYDSHSDVSSYFVVPARGGASKRIGRGGGLSVPTWSPDGTSIALTRGQTLVVIDVRSGTSRPIFSGNENTYISEYEWSPDGKRIALLYLDGPRAELHVVHADGNGDLTVAELGKSDFFSGGLAWSPDSRTIAASFDSEQPAINFFSADGGGSRELAPGQDPVWSPDGQTIAFVALPRIMPDAEAQPASEIGAREDSQIALIGRDGSFHLLTRTRRPAERNVIEVRDAWTGKVVASFNTPTEPRAVALSGSRVALLVAERGSTPTIEIRKLDGTPVRAIAAPRLVGDAISMSGGWIVFKTRETSSRTGIRVVHVRSGAQRVLAHAEGEVVGLSIEGKRVAWAERTGRIRAVALP